MAFPRAHRMLTIFGDAYGARETWQFGLRLDEAPDPLAEGPLTALREIVNGWWLNAATTGAGFASSHRLIGIKLAPVGTDGKYGALNAQESSMSAPSPGGEAGAVVPQQSLVITLQTDVARGIGNKGRIYPPPQPTIQVQADGRITVPKAVAAMETMKVLVTEINDAGHGAVSVGSIGKTVGGEVVAPGTLRPVVSFRCGRVIDTQRRRRSSLVEEYETLPLA